MNDHVTKDNPAGLVRTAPRPDSEGYTLIRLRAENARLRKALANCCNGLDLLLQSHSPDEPDNPWDTINELRQTVIIARAALEGK